MLATLAASDSAAAFENRLATHLEAFNAETGLRMPLCMSIGMHEFEWTSELAVEALVAKADATMYQQKRGEKV